MRTSHAGSLRFPELRQSSQGESGPKPRLRSVGDGHAVHIRQPPMPVQTLPDSVTKSAPQFVAGRRLVSSFGRACEAKG